MQQFDTVIHVLSHTPGSATRLGEDLLHYLSCPEYNRQMNRTIVIGPARSGAYDAITWEQQHPYCQALAHVQQKFRVSVQYRLERAGPYNTQLECVRINAQTAEPYSINALKAWLYDECGLQSDRYENDPRYDQAVKLGPSVLAVLRAVGAADAGTPSLLIAHDELALPVALAATMDPLCAFKTVFHAQQVWPVRRAVESHPGHDIRFYNVMRQADDEGYFLPEVLGSQNDCFRYNLLAAGSHCDAIVTSGRQSLEELRFMAPALRQARMDVLPIPPLQHRLSLQERQSRQDAVKDAVARQVGKRPDYVLVNHGALNPARALWRDLLVLEKLDELLAERDLSAAYLMLDPTPRAEEEKLWTQPNHTQTQLYAAAQSFNERSRAICTVLQTPFGDRLGGRAEPASAELTALDAYLGADVVFAQHIYNARPYESFRWIANGAICVYNNYRRAFSSVDPGLTANLVEADYVGQLMGQGSWQERLHLDLAQREQIERSVAADVAERLMNALPVDVAASETLFQEGRSWWENYHRQNCDNATVADLLHAAYMTPRARKIA